MSFAKVLTASQVLPDFDHTKVFWTIGGGNTLKDWVERRYLDRLGIPQIYLFDSDRTSAALPPLKGKRDRVVHINGRPKCQAFLSEKRTVENYVHPDAIARLSKEKITLPDDIDIDHDDIAKEFKTAFEAAKDAHRNQLGFYPENHDGQKLGLSSSVNNCKKIITSYIMRYMTADEVRDRGRYTRPDGTEGNEIIEWLSAITAHLKET